MDLTKLAAIAARYRAQQAKSIAFPDEPGKTIADDIADALTQSKETQESKETQDDPGTTTETNGTNRILGESGSETSPEDNSPKETGGSTTDKYGNLIQYNEKQQRFIDIASSGQNCVLIGAAGTGKTTCQKGVVQALIINGCAGTLVSGGHKHLPDNTPGIVICAYTRRAVANISKNVSLDMQANCITIHKLLEYRPVYYDIIDPNTGQEKKSMVFEPNRHAGNPLPASIRTIIFEESSMLGLSLYEEVIAAAPPEVQLIFLGDIQQLPPVFGPAILGFKLLEYPVVELTDVYRQALESPIIKLAHRILSGVPIPAAEYPDWNVPGKMTIKPWKKKVSSESALNTAALFFCGNSHNRKPKEPLYQGLHELNQYDPDQDMILIPYGKAFGTIELNLKIANYLAKARKAPVFEIIAGFVKVYLSVGERVLHEKEDAVILKIEKNPVYTGAQPRAASVTMDYHGSDPDQFSGAQKSEADVDFLLAQAASTGERVTQASHVITIQMVTQQADDPGEVIKLDKAAEVNALMLAYALTVHKSQGSEWRKVFCLFHQSHATMLQRELLYTAVTRAKEELYIICEPETFTNGINSQKVKGNTLAEKAEFFKGRKSEMLNYD